MANEGIKKEFLIDSSDAARPQATIDSDTRFYAQGLKPKPRVPVRVDYEETGEIAKTRTGAPVKLILKTTTYDDGTTVDTTVGEENEMYQQFLKTGNSVPSQSSTPTRQRAPKKAAKPTRQAAKKEA